MINSSYALTGYSNKRVALLQAGAKHIIATEEQDLVLEVHRITHNQGARIVFDRVAGPAIIKLAEAIAQRGVIFQYGSISSEPTPLTLFSVLAKQLTICSYTLFEISSNPQRLVRAKEFILKGLSAGKLNLV